MEITSKECSAQFVRRFDEGKIKPFFQNKKKKYFVWRTKKHPENKSRDSEVKRYGKKTTNACQSKVDMAHSKKKSWKHTTSETK